MHRYCGELNVRVTLKHSQNRRKIIGNERERVKEGS